MENRITVRVVRNDSCVAWGFRISGGRDFGAPVTIQRVNPSSVADRHGLRPRDLVISIEGKPTSEMNHSEVQQQIKNAEKVLNLELERSNEPPTTRPVQSDPSPTLANLKIKGTGLEQPASNNRISQPYQGNTCETTLPMPYQSIRSVEIVRPTEEIKAPPIQNTVRIVEQPPPLPSAVADRLASLSGDDGPSLTQVSGHNAQPADLRPFGTTAPPPPTVAPKPAADRKFSADASLRVGGCPMPWKSQNDRKGSMDTSLALSESGLQPVGARKASWDPSSGQRYEVQPWKPPTSATAGMEPNSSTHFVKGDRKDSLDKTSIPTPMGCTAKPWKQPSPTEDDNRKSSWDKSSTLPTMGYTAKPWKPPSPTEDDNGKLSLDKSSTLPTMGYTAKPWKPPSPTGDDNGKSSWDKSSTLPTMGYTAKPWKPPGSDRKQPWDKSVTLPTSDSVEQPWKPPTSSNDVKKLSEDKSASLSREQTWKASESADKGNGRLGSGKKHDAGICFHCKEVVRGPYLMALDRVYCADHFRCCKCDVRLDKQPFIAHQNEVFCQEDYAKHVAEKCAGCGTAIITECLRAMDKAFHPKCFTCTLCQEPIAPGNFRLGSDNKPYCEDDWRDNFQVMCCRCDFPIEPDERFIEALNKSFHAECFECVTCGMKLEGRPFYNRNDKPYCREHVPAQ